jgi:drug/metabolite transporter (DMT)-like permease
MAVMVRQAVEPRPYHRPPVNVRTSGRLSGAALVAFAAICFGTLGPVTRFAADAGVEALPLVTWRATIGALVVGWVMALGMARGRAVSVGLGSIPVRERALMLGGVIAGATVNLGIFLAFLRVSIALTLLLFYLYPTLVAVVSAARFGEPFDRRRVVALSASLLGLVLVFAGAGSLGAIDPIGIALAFLAALAQMFYVLAARHGFASIPSAQAAAITMGGGALVYLAIAAVVGTLPSIIEPLASPAGLGIIVFAGTIGAGLPTLAFVMGIRRLGPPRAAILATLEPVVGVLLAAVLLAEIPAPVQLLGGALVIAGGALSQLGGGPAAEHEAVAGDETRSPAASSPR